MHPALLLHNRPNQPRASLLALTSAPQLPSATAEVIPETSPCPSGTAALLYHPTAPSGSAPSTRWFRSSIAVAHAPKLETLSFAKLHHPRRSCRVMESFRKSLLIASQKERGPLHLCWSREQSTQAGKSPSLADLCGTGALQGVEEHLQRLKKATGTSSIGFRQQWPSTASCKETTSGSAPLTRAIHTSRWDILAALA